MRILYVPAELPSGGEVTCGAAVRSSCLLRALKKTAETDVVYLDDPRIPEKYTLRVKLRNLLSFASLRNYYPVDREKERMLDAAVSGGDYDFIVAHFVDTVFRCGLEKYADRLVVDADDSVAGFERTVARVQRSLPAKLHHLLMSSSLDLGMKRFTSRVRHVFFSDPSVTGYRNSSYLPNTPGCLPPEGGPLCPPADFAAVPPRIIMVGNMGWWPNRVGVDRLVENVFPAVRAAVPDAELHIVGSVDDGCRSRWASVPGVTVMGFVPDLKEEYASCRCAAVSVYHGSGTSIKTLEAIAMGRPLVSSPFGMRGFGDFLKDGEDCLVASSDGEFAAGLVRLLTDAPLGAGMAASAFAKAQKNCGDEVFDRGVKEVFEKLASEK